MFPLHTQLDGMPKVFHCPCAHRQSDKIKQHRMVILVGPAFVFFGWFAVTHDVNDVPHRQAHFFGAHCHLYILKTYNLSSQPLPDILWLLRYDTPAPVPDRRG